MKITYDQETDVLYIGFRETTVTTKELGNGVALDYAEDGKVAGIEFLGASESVELNRLAVDFAPVETARKK